MLCNYGCVEHLGISRLEPMSTYIKARNWFMMLEIAFSYRDF